MKKTLTRSIIIFVFVIISSFAFAQQNHYVVVGVFAVESNSQKFTGYVRSQRFNAGYGLYKKQKLYYVYVMKTADRSVAQAEMRSLHKETEFKDAWVFSGILEGGEDLPLDTEGPPVVEEKTPVVEEPPVTPPVTTPDTTATVDTTTVATSKPQDNVGEEVPATPPAVVKGKLFKFVIQSTDGKPVKGEIHNVDFRRGRDLGIYKTNQYVDILRPSARNNPISLVCGIFGYKEIVKMLDYDNPAFMESKAFQDGNGAWVIPYQLERMKKGDVSVMYHVSFYKDAVVMLPPSKAEMDELVNMMNDNPEYKITIHGHCNGSNSRKIIALGPSKNYFSTQGSSEITGNAKELSKLRAQAVQNYLVEHGIDKSRTQIYAWGSQNMLAPENSPSAKLNDRIEIEITAD
jgi:outer membrane protein OmpA-like peptidoglycan-associated protein